MATTHPLVSSKSVQTARLLCTTPKLRRIYVLPFLTAYILGISGILAYTGTNDLINSLKSHKELLIGVFSVIAFIHLLTYLATFWSISFCVFASYSNCSHPSKSDCIMIIPAKHKGKSEIISIIKDSNNCICFSFQQNKYVWNMPKGTFEKPSFPTGLTFADYLGSSGIKEDAKKELEKFGSNTFHIPHPTFLELFKEHAVAPFFLFQVFCVGLWLMDEYWYYSLFTLVMLIVFECTVVQQRITSLTEFKTMSIKPFSVDCKRSDKWIKCSSEEIVPGDLVLMSIGEGKESVIPCDLLLLDGMCVVNEAMLSGESTPLQKESIKDRKKNVNLYLAEDKIHILFAGTKLLQVNPSTNSEQEKGCLCYVLRTGFHTTQGKLVRTMIYNSENVTANNLESFLFILFLLFFAIAASIYVWKEGIKNPDRSRFKLILECIIIITQVIPPELPMELSLAVNTSLMALSQFAIFCTEPFRIPFAGKVDVCCLDKTGTITEENLVVKGITGVSLETPSDLFECSLSSKETLFVLGGCHSLMMVDEKIAGDPMEIAAFKSTQWNIIKNDTMFDKNTKQAIRIHKKFHFSSALKRMSTVCSLVQSVDGGGTSRENDKYFVSAKGAPEMLHSMLDNPPDWYDSVFRSYAKQGCRVIALAIKFIPKLSSSTITTYSREEAETNLKFCGFLVFHCPLKKDSTKAIESLISSSHKVVMITGDNSLTSIHVAATVGILKDELNCILIDTCPEDESTFFLSTMDDSLSKEIKPNEISAFIPRFDDICVTGSAYDLLITSHLIETVLPKICVFARASPAQKESIMVAYKEQKLITLMCGDGTNDVGALKQAHIGVALLDGKPEDLAKIKKRMQLEAMKKQQETVIAIQQRLAKKLGQPVSTDNPTQTKLSALNNALNDDFLPSVRLGDASVAAPFTSKISTLESICTIIRQGRCTLVTTLQMYKILALNSLISAYSLSVLHLDGIRYADVQSTVMGFLITFCFLFLSKAKPIERLSSKRPQSNIFNTYIMFSILAQFAIHLLCLVFISSVAAPYTTPIKVDSAFEPNLKNSIIYLMSLSMQVCTFMINYQGHPFRESLFENKPLRTCLFGVAAVGFSLALELFPDINEYMQIVPLPFEVKWKLVGVMLFNYVACGIVERGSQSAFANENPKEFFNPKQQYAQK